MRNVLFALLVIFCFSFDSKAELWTMNVGDQYKYAGYDTAGNSWEYILEVVSSTASGVDTIYKIKRSNYENDGEQIYFNIYSNDYRIYVSDDGSSDWGLFFDLTVPSGSYWTAGSTRRVMHGYDSSLGSYRMEQYKVDGLGNRLSPSDNYYITKGFGIVREIDYWVSSNAPFIQQRKDWSPPTLHSRVTEIYVASFGRAPDAAGLAYWVGQVEKGLLTVDQVAMSFFDQPETQAKYPLGTSNATFVTTIYQNVLNRAPDTTGLDYWVGDLDRGTLSRSQAIVAIINGAKAATGDPIDAKILSNKEKVGEYFAASKLGSLSDHAQLLSYAQEVLRGVTSEPESLSAATNYIDTIAGQIVLAPEATLSADPATVQLNQATTLTWTASGVTSCTASGGWSGEKNPAGGSELVNVGGSSGLVSYTLTCTGPVGTASKTVDVGVSGGGSDGSCEQVSLGNSLVKVVNSSNTMIEIYFGTSVAFGADIEPSYCNLVGIELPSSINSYRIEAEITQCTTDPEGGCDVLFGTRKYVPITLQKGVTQEIIIGSGFFN